MQSLSRGPYLVSYLLHEASIKIERSGVYVRRPQKHGDGLHSHLLLIKHILWEGLSLRQCLFLVQIHPDCSGPHINLTVWDNTEPLSVFQAQNCFYFLPMQMISVEGSETTLFLPFSFASCRYHYANICKQ